MSEAAPFDLDAELAFRRQQMREGDEFAARMRARTAEWEQRIDREWPPWAYVVISVVTSTGLIVGGAMLAVMLLTVCR